MNGKGSPKPKDLDILIPTYNRAPFLQKNLEQLTARISANDLAPHINILVSDNCSDDNTQETVRSFTGKYPGLVFYYGQKENTGLEKNTVSILGKAVSVFVMFLGDDDYIREDYLVHVVSTCRKDDRVTCMVPAWQAITPGGEPVPGRGRDLGMPGMEYKAGSGTASKMMWRGHQLSGLVLLRDGLHENYTRNCERNIYPFMYFVGYNCLRGRCYHYTGHPVLVTVTGQDKKDWGYGEDGLIIDRVKNVYSLFRGKYFKRVKAEYIMNKRENRRFNPVYASRGKKHLGTYLRKILFSKYITVFGKMYLLGHLAAVVLKRQIPGIARK